ncbi:MAG: bifunctional DNA-formamidopyrimidine glycosylase/DNA-(apurinic or apyrimidinic site) lyase [Chloroflexi bacterium]|nr:bifunctional DNA-formamidopyrimidine glycosylase/DNA-(apurinic or apyrimidinic site) lyase [Chloroflexota bacterium]
MPELPEVETTARSLRPKLVGRRVCAVDGADWPRMLPNTSEAELQSVLIGHTVASVDRRGKYLLIGFDDDAWVTVHRKMSGNLLLVPRSTERSLHTHLVVGLDNDMDLRFVDPRKFGRVNLFRSSVELNDFLAERLGPDSLVDLDAALLAEKLKGRSGRIKPLLLDQAFVAGVGNLYADEALWEAKLHPLRAANSLAPDEIGRLAEAIKHVLTQGIERRGTSFSSYRDSDGTPGENQEFLNAYGREGQACPRCGTPIRRIQIGQRSSAFCPQCQPVP